MKRIRTILFAIIFTCLLAGCSQTTEVTILHTNDYHGHPNQLALMGSFIKQVRERDKNVLLVDAGDINDGDELSNMFYAEPDILGYNKIGYDCIALGNHDFNIPLEVLKKQFEEADFPFLSCNTFENGKLLAKPYIIKKIGKVKIAIIGVLTRETPLTSMPDKSLSFADEIESVQKYVDEIRKDKKADIIIILSHLGDIECYPAMTTSVELAEGVKGIDLIIDGHSHSYFEKPLYAAGVPIVTAKCYGDYVGEGQLSIKNKKITAFHWHPVAMTAEEISPDPKLSELVSTYDKKADSILGEVICTFANSFDFGNKVTRYKETSAGDLMCDVLADFFRTKGKEVDFAILNGGCFRAGLPAGKATVRDIKSMLPFKNHPSYVVLDGKDVLSCFELIGKMKGGDGGFAQVSKEVHYTLTDKGIENLTIDGKPISTDRNYRIATNDFIAEGGDRYEVFSNATERIETDSLLSDVLIDYLRKQKESVQLKTYGRIKGQRQ